MGHVRYLILNANSKKTLTSIVVNKQRKTNERKISSRQKWCNEFSLNFFCSRSNINVTVMYIQNFRSEINKNTTWGQHDLALLTYHLPEISIQNKFDFLWLIRDLSSHIEGQTPLKPVATPAKSEKFLSNFLCNSQNNLMSNFLNNFHNKSSFF